MRVALCLSGLPRNEINALKSQFIAYSAHLAPEDRIDVFGFFWQGYPEGDDAFLDVIREQIAPHGQLVLTNSAPPYALPFAFRGWTYPEVPSVSNTGSMWKGVEQADLLRRRYEQEHGFKYDLVMRSRPDFFFDGIVHLHRLFRAAQDFVILPRNGHYRQGLNDKWAATSSDNMTLFCALHSQLERYVHDQNIPMHSGTLLTHHLNQIGLPPLFGNYNTHIMRKGVATAG